MSTIRQKLTDTGTHNWAEEPMTTSSEVVGTAGETLAWPHAAGTDADVLAKAAEHQPRAVLPRARIEVFANNPSILSAVDDAAQDRRAVRSEFFVHRGGFAEAIDRYREYPPPDLIIIEESGCSEKLEFQIEALAEFCPPTTRLVIIGERNDILLYRRLTKLGVSDYLVHPITPLIILDGLGVILLEDDAARDLGLVVAVVGARGGVGSSTLAHNAAAILRRRFDATTLLIDADMGFGTAALQFDISPPHSLGDALKERDDLDGEVLERLTYWLDKRFGILAAPDRLDHILSPDPDGMRHLIEQSRRIASYIVLDLPSGWAPQTVEAITAADRVVVVATPDLPSLRNSRNLMEMIRKLRPNDAPAHLVLNRMPTKGKPAISQEDFSRVLDRKISVVLPCDETAVSSEMAGQLLCDTMPRCQVVQSIDALITEIVGRGPLAKASTAPKSLLRRLFSREQ